MEPDIVAVRSTDDEVEAEYEFRQRYIERDLSLFKKFGYGIGHFYNDLCASMWFTYLMIFLKNVLSLPSKYAGTLMLIGQVTDAVSTPLVGIASDHNVLPKWLSRIGCRISWHLIGTVLVSFSFPFIFNKCFICADAQNSPDWITLLWFTPFIMVFQFGWASVQISHLALIPELSSLDSSRTTMNSLRYAFTVLANIAVFTVLALLFSNNESEQKVGPEDFKHFQMAGMLVVVAGLIVSFMFYAITREPDDRRSLSRLHSFSSDASEFMRMHWTNWFGFMQFYQIALLYMLSRLYVNISQVYFPFYITITQSYDKKFVAILPMVSYISSFIVSTVIGIPAVNDILNRKFLLFVGILGGICTCGWMYFTLSGWTIYVVSALIGVTQAILLITSLSITADLINRNTESGAFVYGSMSFVDKLANGISYLIIEMLTPKECSAQEHAAECSHFYREIMVYVPGGCLILALLVLMSLIPSVVGYRSRRVRLQETDREPIINEDDEEPVLDMP